MKTKSVKGILIPLSITIICLIFLIPNSIIAQNNQGNNVKTITIQGMPMGDKNPNAVKLTDDQKTKMKDLRVEHMKAIQLLKSQNQEMAAHLKTLNLADKPDNKAIFKTIDEMMANRGEIMKRTISFKQATKAILTPDQIKALELRRGNRGGMMMRGRNQMFGQGGRNNFGRGQMQRGGMMMRGGQNRPGQMMQMPGQFGQRGMGQQGQMMNPQGRQGFGGGQLFKIQSDQPGQPGQMQKRIQIIKKDGQPKTPDTTKTQE